MYLSVSFREKKTKHGVHKIRINLSPAYLLSRRQNFYGVYQMYLNYTRTRIFKYFTYTISIQNKIDKDQRITHFTCKMIDIQTFFDNIKFNLFILTIHTHIYHKSK